MWTLFAKNRIKVIIAAASIVALYAVYGISYQLGLNSLREEASRSLDQLASALFVPIEKYSYLPEVVASQPIIADTLIGKRGPVSIDQANAYLENINEIAKVEAIYIMDQEGLTIAASNWKLPLSFVGKNYSFRPYFQDAIKGGAGKFYALGTTSRTPGYYLSYPVKAGSKIIGVVAVKIDLSNFDREWHDNYPYEVTVSDEHGINFLSSVRDWKYRPMEELKPDALHELMNTRRYDSSLNPPLPVLKRESLGEKSQYLTISLPDNTEDGARGKPYVLTTGKLSWSAWNMNIFMPADKVHGEAIRHAAVAGALALLLALSLLYWGEFRRRAAEREKAKLDIEKAHAELEEKHRQLEVLSQELMHLASVDELTGSHNRRFFFEIAGKMQSGAVRHKLPLSFIIIDVDFFKRINDEYGHHVGDKVLRQISQICSSDLREEDVFARLGGEEFVMALMPTQEKEAMDIAERLRQGVLKHLFIENGAVINVTISCGVAQFHLSDVSIENTLQRADKALYEAKKSGRNQIAVAQLRAQEQATAKEALPLP